MISMRPMALGIVLAALAACSSNSPQPAPSGSRSAINPERSSRGNPPYYEVFGKRYYVLESSDGFREQGIASWYGHDFHGKATSSGEVYDMRQLTAAHKTLPIPTWVEVTNLSNGRQVIVKVNDRGPFVDDRIIDLSERAAEELDMIETGTVRVRIRALGTPVDSVRQTLPVLADTPPEQPRNRGFSLISSAEAATVSPSDTVYRPVYVQVGAFSDRDNATKLVRQLKDEGFDNSFVLTSGQGRDRLHRVRIGPISDSSEFDQVQSDLRAVGVFEARLVQDN